MEARDEIGNGEIKDRLQGGTRISPALHSRYSALSRH
jgi:hypothetical protein